MPDFINTIDVLGDDVVMDSIIERTITEFKDDQITKIGSYGFYNCKNLILVDLPNVNTVDNCAFQNCELLEELNLPSVTSFGTGQSMTASGCKKLSKINLPLLTNLPTHALSRCDSLKRVELPSAITIRNIAFSEDAALEYVNLPVASTIQAQAFNLCKNLKALILRNGVMCVLENTNAFTNTGVANGTGYIYVPGNLVSSYKSATNWSTYKDQFRGILGDEEGMQGIIDETLVDYENNEIENIPAYSFYKYAPLKSVKSDSVTEIGDHAFQGCSSLQSVDLPLVTSIGSHAFRECTNLTSVNMPLATDPGYWAFHSCKNLVSVSFPSARKIHQYSFGDSTNLRYADFANLTGQIQLGAFVNTSLAALVLRCKDAICTLVNVNAFVGTPIAKSTGFIYVPRALIEDYKVAENWSTYAAQFRALEDYTVDGTTTGELDESKI